MLTYRLDLDLKSFSGTAFRQQIFYRNGVPERRAGPFRLTFTTGVRCIIWKLFLINMGVPSKVSQLVENFEINILSCDSSDGRVVRASAMEAVDLGLIPSQVKPMTLKLIFTASLLDAQL